MPRTESTPIEITELSARHLIAIQHGVPADSPVTHEEFDL